jgi:hypothetical protein
MAHRPRKDLAAARRRVEDEGDEEGTLDAGDLDDDSLSEASVTTDGDELHEGDEPGPAGDSETSPELPKPNGKTRKQPKDGRAKASNGAAAPGFKKPESNGVSDMDMMLNGLKLSDKESNVEGVHYEDLRGDVELREDVELQEPSPAVVNSSAQMDQTPEGPYERRRREHEEYKKKRDEDPAFVPNRGAFFMHDHRHAGPAANGFRPFGRGRGRGKAGIGGPYAPIKYVILDLLGDGDDMLTTASHIPQPFEPTDAPWAHDMHEVISAPSPRLQATGYINGSPATRMPPKGPTSSPPNREFSTTKHVGNVQVRVLFADMETPLVFPGVPVKQYTLLPDHRPPLRRDKQVRISLPDHQPRYVWPAIERSFIFIPRAMRPNQQGFGRGKGRPGLGSLGGYSRRTSAWGGSVYGSVYSPSVAMSRRSSLAREVNRESLISPSGSTVSRPQMQADVSRPIVRLPPASHIVPPPQPADAETDAGAGTEQPSGTPVASTSIDDLPPPQTYPLPQKPTFRENRPTMIPMHQPRPQKAVSVADIESPATLSFNAPQPQQQPFHHQVPIQVNGNGQAHDAMLHTRNASYPSQASTGTPLSQIPERAIHAQPFQPQPYQQPSQNYYPQPYQVLQPAQGYYYQQGFNPPMGSSGPGQYVPNQQPQQAPPQQQAPFSQPGQPSDAGQAGAPNLVAQEVNGMVYYYDANQIPAVAAFPAYSAPQAYHMQPVGGVVGMGGMMTPSPDGFYYPQGTQGVVYYQQ